MVKKSMKEHKNDKGLHRLLDARQLGLKLIANVTYGYTAASFSGRMPCVEVADSIVRKARETLERAIKLVEERPEWGARVVYGDTDRIGHEICDAVTAMNPQPIKLKFEKVYYPCVLQTKKRYVGYSYETLDQKEPVFDAKGIETVRRDSCAAVSKILERSIKILFGCKDVSKVKEYVLRQCRKFMECKVSMQDCVFAKEYRGMKGYKPGACVPALEIAKLVVCNTCMGVKDESQPCVSLDCPIMFRRVLAKQDVQKGTQLREVVNKVLDF
uniref:DNA-directed DNA polymerase n=1 Tax=Magallana gigas TaxID=29159 RepID=K1QBY0_MAGGI